MIGSRKAQRKGSSMCDVSTAAQLISRAEVCSEFRQFCEQFSAWEIQCWLGPREKALHFGIGAFNPNGANLLEIGTFEGASALYHNGGSPPPWKRQTVFR